MKCDPTYVFIYNLKDFNKAHIKIRTPLKERWEIQQMRVKRGLGTAH